MRKGNERTGGELVVDCLRANGVDTVFCVPGESYLAVLDAFVDAPDIDIVVCRQEGGAAMMADAYAKLTGRPGICFVTRAPGATNASAGIHIAFQDSSPVILFIGQVPRGVAEREAFQEIDFRRMYGPLTKWVAEIEDAGRVPELVSRAFHTAQAGRAGPVALALPEDMLRDRAPGIEVPPARPGEPHPGAADMAAFAELLNHSERPLMIVGGGGWSAQVRADIARFAESHNIPIAASFRCQDYLDNRAPAYAGNLGIGMNPALFRRVRDADLLIVAGARLGEITTSDYSLVQPPFPDQTLVHIHPGAEELGRVYRPHLALNASMRTFAEAARALTPSAGERRKAWVAAAHTDYLDWSTPIGNPGPLQLAEIVSWLGETLPEDAIVTNGAGNYTGWVHRFYRYRGFRTQLAPTSGSMGYGLPAAVAAKKLHPERMVVCMSGDGCFLMHGQELATAVQYGLGIIILLVNNGMYGTIRMHQERHYPGRVSASGLVNPDFAALARAYGCYGECVSRTEDFAAAFGRAAGAGGPALLELRLDPEAISAGQTLSGLREAALARAQG